MPSQLTKLEFLARSEIDETTLTDSAGAIDRFYELSLQHAFWRYFVLGTFVSYEIGDYAGDPQVDQRVKAGLTGDYYFKAEFLYRYRNLVERFFNKLKHFRGVATRYDKRPENYLAGVKLASARIWMRANESMA